MIRKIKPVSPGFNWSVSTGYDTNEDGAPIRGTDEKIIKGWAPTREQAKEQSDKAIQKLKDES